MTAALQRTRAYYSPVDDSTQFDLHIPNCRASASGFVYGLTDQRAPHVSLFVSCTHTEGQFGFYYRGAKNCNFLVHLINTELISTSCVRSLTFTYCTVQSFPMRKSNVNIELRNQRSSTPGGYVFL